MPAETFVNDDEDQEVMAVMEKYNEQSKASPLRRGFTVSNILTNLLFFVLK